jgi:hypothetical protein
MTSRHRDGDSLRQLRSSLSLKGILVETPQGGPGPYMFLSIVAQLCCSDGKWLSEHHNSEETTFKKLGHTRCSADRSNG